MIIDRFLIILFAYLVYSYKPKELSLLDSERFSNDFFDFIFFNNKINIKKKFEINLKIELREKEFFTENFFLILSKNKNTIENSKNINKFREKIPNSYLIGFYFERNNELKNYLKIKKCF